VKPVVLAAEGLSLRLGENLAVDGISIGLHAGQWAAIVGPNGAGKSTLLALLAGLRRPDAGTVRLHGRLLADVPARERAQRLAWLAQQGEAEGEIAARDVVRLGRLPRHGLFGAPDASDEAAVDRALAETEATAFATRRLSELSGGERQRVLLARALAVDAAVLLAGRTHHAPGRTAPACADAQPGRPRTRRRGRGRRAARPDTGLAADRVLVLERGRLVADGAPASAELRQALVQVFEHALSIEAVTVQGRQRWVAVPAV
jgi:iron complex transport system ATP-binding protein